LVTRSKQKWGEIAQDGIGKVGEAALRLNADTLGGMSVRSKPYTRPAMGVLDQKWQRSESVRRSMSKLIDSMTF
jgi:hypothetical protein